MLLPNECAWHIGQGLATIGAALVAFPRDGRERRVAIADVLERHALLVAEPHADRVRAAARLLRRGRLGDAEIVVGAALPDGTPAWVVIADTGRSVTDEELRQTWGRHERQVTLADHGAAVAGRVAAIAERLSLGEALVGLLRTSGELHDEGKRDPRFQAMLRGEAGAEETGPLAKSGDRRPAEARLALARSGLPTGWRHEQLSAAHAWSRLGGLSVPDRQLVTRLVGTSHGRGRSGFPHAADGLLGMADAALPAARDLYDDGAWDELVERTDAAAGVWGCAFLEALLRAADGQVSGEGQ